MISDIIWEFEDARASGVTLDAFFPSLAEQHRTGKVYAALASVDFEHHGRELRRLQSYLDALASIDDNPAAAHSFLQMAYASLILGPPPCPSLNELRKQSGILDWPPLSADDDLVALDQIIAGRYRVIRRLGAGAFGIAYLIQCTNSSDAFVLKAPATNRDEESRQAIDALYRYEAEVAAQLDHPGIPQFIDLITVEDRPGIVMEHIPGTPLHERLRSGPLDHRQVALLVQQVADALHHCHAHRITHRDVSPDNIILGPNHRATLIDFGLALRQKDQFTKEGQVAGKLVYSAPNVILGMAHQTDGRDDIWSLGMILLECLTGNAPRTAHKEQSLVQAVLVGKMVDEWLAEVPAEMRAICQKCLERNPAFRFQSAEQVANALEEYIAVTKPAPTLDEIRDRLWKIFSLGVTLGELQRHYDGYEYPIEFIEDEPSEAKNRIGYALLSLFGVGEAYTNALRMMQELDVPPSDLPTLTADQIRILFYQASRLSLTDLPKIKAEAEAIHAEAGHLMELVPASITHSSPSDQALFELGFVANRARGIKSGPVDVRPLAQMTVLSEETWQPLADIPWAHPNRKVADPMFDKFEKDVQHFLLHVYAP